MRWRVRMEFEPRDMWIGVYWERHVFADSGEPWVKVFVCLLPCLPITIERRAA